MRVPSLPPSTDPQPANTGDTLPVRLPRRSRRTGASPGEGLRSTYRQPSVLRLKPGPLHKLGWIFGFR